MFLFNFRDFKFRAIKQGHKNTLVMVKCVLQFHVNVSNVQY